MIVPESLPATAGSCFAIIGARPDSLLAFESINTAEIT